MEAGDVIHQFSEEIFHRVSVYNNNFYSNVAYSNVISKILFCGACVLNQLASQTLSNQ